MVSPLAHSYVQPASRHVLQVFASVQRGSVPSWRPSSQRRREFEAAACTGRRDYLLPDACSSWFQLGPLRLPLSRAISMYSKSKRVDANCELAVASANASTTWAREAFSICHAACPCSSPWRLDARLSPSPGCMDVISNSSDRPEVSNMHRTVLESLQELSRVRRRCDAVQ